MDKFIPFEKLSKREKRKRNAQRRTTWGTLNPVTRKPQNPKAYNRQKTQRWNDDSGFAFFVFNDAGCRAV